MTLKAHQDKLLHALGTAADPAQLSSLMIEIADHQRTFDWRAWDFGYEVIKTPSKAVNLSPDNVCRLIYLLVKTSDPTRLSTTSVVKALQARISEFSDQTSWNVKPDFDFRSDTPPNKDPDSFSKTLRQYHKRCWSGMLHDGTCFDLRDDVPKSYLHAQTPTGEFRLSSDAISNSHRNNKHLTEIVAQVPEEVMTNFINSFNCIGGYMLFPAGQQKGSQTINQARGCNHRIVDRFDLTLECIKRFYDGVDSPLTRTFSANTKFFELFGTFESYVDYFCLQDLVTNGSREINFFLPFDSSFPLRPFPRDLDQYMTYLKRTQEFIQSRTERIMNRIN